MWGDEIGDVEQTLFHRDYYHHQRNAQLAADMSNALFNSIDRSAEKIEAAHREVAAIMNKTY